MLLTYFNQEIKVSIKKLEKGYYIKYPMSTTTWTTPTTKHIYYSGKTTIGGVTINQLQSINLSSKKRHRTRHQGRMQPPLTGACKNNVIKQQMTIPKKETNWQKNAQIQHCP